MKKIIFCFCLLLLANIASSHNELVHQWLLRKGFEYMKYKYTGSSQELIEIQNECYTNSNSNASNGAFYEDFYDPIFANNNNAPWPLPNDAYVTLTHFWDADNSIEDAQTVLYYPFGITITSPNAWQKAKIYLGDPNANELITINEGGYLKNQYGNSIYYQSVKIRYTSIIDFYKYGTCYAKYKIPNSNTEYELFNAKIENAHAYCYNIIGRICHLLQDMSVPAHVHNDQHATGTDPYEEYIRSYFIGAPENQPFSELEANVGMGGLQEDQINVLYNSWIPHYSTMGSNYTNNMFKHLFFTTNQIADWFPSADFNGDENVFSSAISTYSTNYLEKKYLTLQGTSHNQPYILDEIATKTLAFSIRATATVLYWFGRETGQLTKDLGQEFMEQYNCNNTTFIPPSIIENQVIPNDNFLNKSIQIIYPNGQLLVWRNLTVCNNSEVKNSSNICVGGPSTYPCLFKISSGSNIELKEQTSSLYIYSGSELRLKKGSNFTMKTGARLIIKEGGKLILEENTNFYFDAGAQIVLEGNNSILEIGGNLILQDGATFTFTGNGQINFTSLTWNNNVIAQGNNCKFILQGNSSSDVVLKLDKKGWMWPNDQLKEFRVTNGKIEYNYESIWNSTYCTITLGCPYLFENVNFDGIGILHTGGRPNSVINNCNFDQTSIRGDLFYYGAPLKISNSYFSNNSSPINVYGKSVILNNLNFTNCSYPIIGNGCDQNSNIDNCNFSLSNAEQAITWYGSNQGMLNIQNSNLNNCLVGLDLSCGNANMRKNQITNNGIYGIYVGEDAKLNMSALTKLGGFNIVANNGMTYHQPDFCNIYFSKAHNPQLSHGFNQFQRKLGENIHGNTIDYKTFKGTLNNNGQCTIDARGNIWTAGATAGQLFSLYSADGTCPNGVNVDIRNVAIETDPGTIPWPIGGSILSICNSCTNIHTTHFNNTPLNEAVTQALRQMESFDPTKNDLDAIQLFSEILTYPYENNTNDEQLKLLQVAYENMKTALANAFTTGKITRDENVMGLHPQVQQMLDVYLLQSEKPTSENYLEQFYNDMSKAQLMRMSGRYDDALFIIDTLNKCFLEEEQLNEIKNWKILATAEKRVISGEYSIIQFDSLKKGFYIPEKLAPTVIDSTSQIDGTVKMGTNVHIGSNTKIEKDVIIGNNVTIGNNCHIKKECVIADGTVIGDNCMFDMKNRTGIESKFGNYNTIKKECVFGKETKTGNNVSIEEGTKLGGYVELGNNVALKKEVLISDGTIVGNNVQFEKNDIIGNSVYIGAGSRIGQAVVIGDRANIGTNAIIGTGAKIGTDAKVANNATVGSNANICDGKSFSGTLAANAKIGTCTTPSAPAAGPNQVVYDCRFAMMRARYIGNYFNGFDAKTKDTTQLVFTAGEPITFKSDHLAIDYSWNFGDCTTSTDENPDHTFAKPGTYIITLTRNVKCQTVVQIGAITVYPKAMPAFDMQQKPICSGSKTVEISRTGSLVDMASPACFTSTTSCVSYLPLDSSKVRMYLKWDFDSIRPALTEYFTPAQMQSYMDSLLKITYPDYGMYEITLYAGVQAKDRSTGNWITLDNEISNVFKINVTPAIQPLLYTDTIVCSNTEVMFSVTISGGKEPYQYNWNFGDSTSAQDSYAIHTYTQPGSYPLMFRATDDEGCETVVNKTVIVNNCVQQYTLNGTLQADSLCGGGSIAGVPLYLATQGQNIDTAITDAQGGFSFELSLSASDTMNELSVVMHYHSQDTILANGTISELTPSTLHLFVPKIKADFTIYPQVIHYGDTVFATAFPNWGLYPYQYAYYYSMDGNNWFPISQDSAFNSGMPILNEINARIRLVIADATGCSDTVVKPLKTPNFTVKGKVLLDSLCYNQPARNINIRMLTEDFQEIPAITEQSVNWDGSFAFKIQEIQADTKKVCRIFIEQTEFVNDLGVKRISEWLAMSPLTLQLKSVSAEFNIPDTACFNTPLLLSAEAELGKMPYNYRWVDANNNFYYGNNAEAILQDTGFNSILLIIRDAMECERKIYGSVFIKPCVAPMLGGKLIYKPECSAYSPLGKLIALVDSNGIQLTGITPAITDSIGTFGFIPEELQRLNPTHRFRFSIDNIVKEDDMLRSLAEWTMMQPIELIYKTIGFTIMNTDSVCPYTDLTFSTDVNYGVPPFNYLWEYDNGMQSTEETVTLKQNESGNYNITLSIRDAQGCEATVEKTYFVKPCIFPTIDGYLSFDAVCGGAGSVGKSVVLLQYDGNLLPGITPAETNTEGYFSFIAPELIPWFNSNKPFSLATADGVALFGGQQRLIQDWISLGTLYPVIPYINKEWRTTHSNTDSTFAVGTCLDLNGNVYVAGLTYNTTTGQDIGLIRMKPSGSTDWAVIYNNPNNGKDHPYDLLVNNGKIWIVGESRGPLGNTDYVLLKYDTSGTLEQTINFNYQSSNDVAKAIVTDNSGNIYVTGTGISSRSSSDIVTLKYDTAGNQVWMRNFEPSFGMSDEIAVSMKMDKNNYLVICGYGGPNSDFVIVKYDLDGGKKWQYFFYNQGGYNESVAMTLDNDNNIYVTGKGESEGYSTVKFSPDGALLWSAQYSATITSSSTAISTDLMNNVYVTGYCDGRITTVKYNSSGTQQWVARYNNPEMIDNKALAMVVDSLGNAYITGYINTDAQFNGDIVTLKYNTEGVLQWAQREFTGSGNYNISGLSPRGADIALSPNNNVYVTGLGWLNQHAVAVTLKYSQCNNTGVLLKTTEPIAVYSSDEKKTIIETIGNSNFYFNLYPNPNSGKMMLNYSLPISTGSPASFEIRDVTGRIVYSMSLQQEKGMMTVQLPGLSSGVYYYRVLADGVEWVKEKVVVIR